MAKEERESLLLVVKEKEKIKSYYHENCPGCQVERQKQECPNPPWLHFFFIWIIALAAALPALYIFPFLYYMIRDFHIAEREEDVSFYAGFEGSAFMVGRTLTAVLWGMVADRYGRRPVMIFSSMAVVICNTLFGLSTSYWMALTTRFLLGALCGILGPIRAYATEVCRREHQSLGMAMVSSSWGIGLVVGPAIGGYLAQPAEKFPNLFSQESIFGRFPYLLVSLVISVFALVVFFICFWLPETLHTHKAHGETHDQPRHLGNVAVNESYDEEKLQNIESKNSTSWFSLLRNWPLMSAIIVFCVFQLHDMAYVEVFSLWGVSPRAYGGVGLSSEDIGQALAVAGVGLLLCQLFLYPIFERTFGPITISRVFAVLSIVLLSSYPFIAKLSGWRLTVLIDLASALKNVLSVSITTGLFLLQNRAVSQEQRGAANGISLCAMSFCKAIGPAAAGSLLSWGQTRQEAHFLPGSHMVFFILNAVELVGFLMTFRPFLVNPAQELI